MVSMKNYSKLLGIIVMLTVIGLVMAGCGPDPKADLFVSSTNDTTANDVPTLGITGTAVSSSSSAVATAEIAGGKIKITSVSAGTATITVSEGAKQATISVTVSDTGAITLGTIVKYVPQNPPPEQTNVVAPEYRGEWEYWIESEQEDGILVITANTIVYKGQTYEGIRTEVGGKPYAGAPYDYSYVYQNGVKIGYVDFYADDGDGVLILGEGLSSEIDAGRYQDAVPAIDVSDLNTTVISTYAEAERYILEEYSGIWNEGKTDEFEITENTIVYNGTTYEGIYTQIGGRAQDSYDYSYIYQYGTKIGYLIFFPEYDEGQLYTGTDAVDAVQQSNTLWQTDPPIDVSDIDTSIISITGELELPPNLDAPKSITITGLGAFEGKMASLEVIPKPFEGNVAAIGGISIDSNGEAIIDLTDPTQSPWTGNGEHNLTLYIHNDKNDQNPIRYVYTAGDIIGFEDSNDIWAKILSGSIPGFTITNDNTINFDQFELVPSNAPKSITITGLDGLTGKLAALQVLPKPFEGNGVAMGGNSIDSNGNAAIDLIAPTQSPWTESGEHYLMLAIMESETDESPIEYVYTAGESIGFDGYADFGAKIIAGLVPTFTITNDNTIDFDQFELVPSYAQKSITITGLPVKTEPYYAQIILVIPDEQPTAFGEVLDVSTNSVTFELIEAADPESAVPWTGSGNYCIQLGGVGEPGELYMYTAGGELDLESPQAFFDSLVPYNITDNNTVNLDQFKKYMPDSVGNPFFGTWTGLAGDGQPMSITFAASTFEIIGTGWKQKGTYTFDENVGEITVTHLDTGTGWSSEPNLSYGLDSLPKTFQLTKTNDTTIEGNGSILTKQP
jgi:hypothetical protein